jgi:hypothetical protein
MGKPLLWRYKWPSYIVKRLATDKNPNGTISNSDLELAGSLLYLDVFCQCFDVRELTGVNLSTTFWERSGSTTSTKPPAHQLRLLESTNISKVMSHNSTTFRAHQTTWQMLYPVIFTYPGLTSSHPYLLSSHR